MRIRHTVAGVIIAVAVSMSLACSGGSGDSGRNSGSMTEFAVEAVQARYGSLPLIERLSGVVRAKNQVDIYPEISAVIVEVFVENGSVVEKGRQLLRLRDREYMERLKQARASYEIALAQARQAEARLSEVQADLERVESLARKDLASTTELTSARTAAISAEADVALAEARIGQAQAAVDERQEALSQTVVRAPVAGTVGSRNAEVGMLVSSGTRLFTLGRLDAVRVDIVLTDKMLSYIETGQRIQVSAERAPLGVLTATLSRISPFLHPVTHTTEAEIDIVNTDGALRPGMFVPVDIYYGESRQATLVPLSALHENPVTGATGVYLCLDSLNQMPVEAIADSRQAPLTEPVSFDFVPVTVIARGRMHAAVEEISPGGWVVTIGQDLLSGKAKTARVRTVSWERVEKLQNLQREGLLREVMQRQQALTADSAST